MADPVTKKIDTLADLSGIAASGDKMVVIDASDTDPVTKTKLVAMNQLSIHTATQLAANVVENSQIKDGAVTNSKLGADAVTSAKIASKTIVAGNIADNTITATQLADNAVESAKIKDLNVTTGKLAANSVTEAKLGTIKRTVVLRVTSPIDDVEVINYGGLFPWAISLNNFVVVDARINLAVAGSTDTTVVLSNQGGTMSTLTLASGATGMSASGTIATSYKTAITNGFLGVNVTAAGTGAKGLSITLVLQGVPA